jgi:hypothetical protein
VPSRSFVFFDVLGQVRFPSMHPEPYRRPFILMHATELQRASTSEAQQVRPCDTAAARNKHLQLTLNNRKHYKSSRCLYTTATYFVILTPKGPGLKTVWSGGMGVVFVCVLTALGGWNWLCTRSSTGTRLASSRAKSPPEPQSCTHYHVKQESWGATIF